MKKLILTFGIVLAGLFTVQAQEQKTDKQVDKVVTEYTSVAQLTPDQVTKVKPMVETFIATRKANKEKYANDAEGLKTANKANRENLISQLSTVLSADQIQKIKDHIKAQKQRSKASGNTNE
jgi:hypothetical protein